MGAQAKIAPLPCELRVRRQSPSLFYGRNPPNRYKSNTMSRTVTDDSHAGAAPQRELAGMTANASNLATASDMAEQPFPAPGRIRYSLMNLHFYFWAWAATWFVSLGTD